ncbi:MAG: FAD:protein FMN transferase [Nakamurella sp.]
MTPGVAVDSGPVRREVAHLMGMPISLALRGRHADTTTGRRAWSAFIARLRRVDQVFSTYREDSVISRLGRGELTQAQCPAEVLEVLDLGRAAEEQSGGAFSVWLPDGRGGTRLEPSGVVKGWAIQRASRHLAALDDTDWCVSAGGDMVCHVADPDRPDWRIGVEHPLDPTRVIAVIPVRTGAVATSGTAHRGQHLIDARTGRPATGVASVTVTGPSLTWADIDATAAYVQGAVAAEWLRTRAGRSALVVWPDATTTIIDGRLPSGW